MIKKSAITLMVLMLFLLSYRPSFAAIDQLDIVSPLDGAVVQQGAAIAILATVGEEWSVEKLHIFVKPNTGHGSAADLLTEISAPPYEAVYAPDPTFVGELEITAVALLAGENDGLILTSKTTVKVLPSEIPVSVETNERMIVMYPPGTADVPSTTIRLLGRFSDGSVKQVNKPGFGATYAVSDPSVVSIAGGGTVTALSVGETLVEVSYQGLSDWVQVSVFDIDNNIFPQAIEHTDNISVARSGFRVDLSSGRILQRVQVTNISDKPIAAPLVLVLGELTSGVSISNESSFVTSTLAPVGSPAIRVGEEWTEDLLYSGQTVFVDLQFSNPDGIPIDYNPKIYRSFAD